MPAPQYEFHSTWRVPAPPDAVFAALAALQHYPTWWPQVRRAQALGPDACALTIRALIPLPLRVVATHQRRDPDALVLRAGLTGDLIGYSRWTLVGQEHGTAALFEERVELHHRLARRLRFLRPALELNHALMMRQGQLGLRALLAT